MLYERMDVYRRPPGQAEIIVYRCLRLLSGDGYVVQSADWIQFPLSVADIASHELRFCELLLEEAIQAFDEEFRNAWQQQCQT